MFQQYRINSLYKHLIISAIMEMAVPLCHQNELSKNNYEEKYYSITGNDSHERQCAVPVPR